MSATLLLDRANWDLVVDAFGNIAVATEPYSLAQDAASAINTWLGEVYFDSTLGVPWLPGILGSSPLPLALLKAQLVEAAEAASDDISSAAVFITAFSNRLVQGQVQVTQAATGLTSAPFPFSVSNPQGAG